MDIIPSTSYQKTKKSAKKKKKWSVTHINATRFEVQNMFTKNQDKFRFQAQAMFTKNHDLSIPFYQWKIN